MNTFINLSYAFFFKFSQYFFFYICLIFVFIVSCSKPYDSLKLSYGAFVKADGIKFKLHAPSSIGVDLILFDDFDDRFGNPFPMKYISEGDWEIFIKDIQVGTIYGYRLIGPNNIDSVIIADPYSKAAITQNKWRYIAKSLVIDDYFDWEGDQWVNHDHNNLVIYETHIRDMTKHSSSKVQFPGTYIGFIEKNQRGGIEYLKKLGINAIQFLPIWDYANVEIPYMKKVAGLFNDWNPYERNHWGYMPTFFFAPESYYASDGVRTPGAWNGQSGIAVREFKTLVRELHKNQIAVILDVVINHVSNYDLHPLKYIDKEIYFKLDQNGNFLSQCCGNLLNTDNKKTRQLIIESLKYWMINYHIDGFRFDQAHLLSSETAKIIYEELIKINPNVIIYGEAWDNRNKEFSEMNWGSFNDRFRDVLRGDLHNYDNKGFLFGSYRKGENKNNLKSIINGSTLNNKGVYSKSFHSINFLQVHDDYSFNDYVRLSLGENKTDDIIKNKFEHITLSSKLDKINRLGALILLTSKGTPLIHQGQEWGSSKIISKTLKADINIGKMDSNPYNKDNETNWVDWRELDQNKNLVDFYEKLIKIRKFNFQFGKNHDLDFNFIDFENEYCLGYSLNDTLLVFFNGDNINSIKLNLPNGEWNVLLATNEGSFQNKVQEKTVFLNPISGVILKRK